MQGRTVSAMQVVVGMGLLGEESVIAVMRAVDAYRQNRELEILADFVDLLSIPNVASSLADMQQNADHIIGLLQPRGFQTQQLNAGGAPYIYAELNSPEATRTLLMYAHFDGQPVIEENWTYPPFSPTLLDGPLEAGARVIDLKTASGGLHPESRLYARSAGDDKMPIIALLHAIDALAANDMVADERIMLRPFTPTPPAWIPRALIAG